MDIEERYEYFISSLMYKCGNPCEKVSISCSFHHEQIAMETEGTKYLAVCTSWPKYFIYANVVVFLDSVS